MDETTETIPTNSKNLFYLRNLSLVFDRSDNFVGKLESRIGPNFS